MLVPRLGKHNLKHRYQLKQFMIMDYCHFQQLQLTEEFMSSVLLVRRLYSSVMNYRNLPGKQGVEIYHLKRQLVHYTVHRGEQ